VAAEAVAFVLRLSVVQMLIDIDRLVDLKMDGELMEMVKERWMEDF
jgi:hypothetical protein